MAEQPGVHEHRRRPQRVAQRALLGHSSIGSASSRTRPPRAHPLIERDEILGRLGARLRHQQEPALRQLGLVGDADRNHPIARLERLQRRRAAALDRELLAEHQRQAGQQQERRALRRRPRRRARRLPPGNGISEAAAPITTSSATTRRAAARGSFASLAVLLAVDAPGARPSSASGSLGSFDAACCAALVALSLVLERLMIEPEQDEQEGECEPGEPDADALRAASGLVGHRFDEAMARIDTYASGRT